MTGPLPRLMTTAEVARAFGVRPETVRRWGTEGRLRSIRTLGGGRRGGHRRYLAEEVEQLLAEARKGSSFPADTAEEL